MLKNENTQRSLLIIECGGYSIWLIKCIPSPLMSARSVSKQVNMFFFLKLAYSHHNVLYKGNGFNQFTLFSKSKFE